MHSITLDFETYSEASLKDCGAYVYAEHPSTEVLCLAWADEEDEPLLWLPGQPVPFALEWHLRRKTANFRAHNAAFERVIWREVMHKRHGWPDIPLERWRCTMAACAYKALPLSLDDAGAALNLRTVKDKRGKELIRKLCQPRKPTKADPSTRCTDPALLNELYEYCLQDVRAEQALHKVVGDLPKDEQDVWFLDQRINDAGIRCDEQLLGGASAITAAAGRAFDQRMSELTGGAVTSCSQSVALAKYLNLDSVSKEAVEAALQGATGTVREILGLRRQAARSSTAKLQKLSAWSGRGGRVRGMLQYHGATTGRWAGRGPQPQNMPRPKPGYALPELVSSGSLEAVELVSGDPLEAVASSLRGVYVAPPGKELVWADFSAIEARVVLWLAGQDDALNIFYRGEDIYCEMASHVYGRPITKDNKVARQTGKTIVLACGYGMGAKKFQITAARDGQEIDEEDALHRVTTYRERFAKVPRLWRGLENAARSAIREPKAVFRYGRTAYCYRDDFLKCRLPSGRLLHYCQPRLEPPDEAWKPPQVSAMAMQTTSTGGKAWMRGRLWGGDLTNHVVQGTARDLMVAAMFRLENAGFRVILTVHDEIVLEVEGQSVDTDLVERLMAEAPSWAEGCPIAAEVSKGARYGK